VLVEAQSSEQLSDEPVDDNSLHPGIRLERYELLVPIARGGMARVWAARLRGQRGFQKLVAIKTILPHLAIQPEFERMFLDEARIAAGVHHPNVCEIYELGEERNTLYLAMEWVSGDSLARVIRASGKSEAIAPRVVARVVADACAGLHVAHELTDDDGRALGVVHRDVSPHNILLTADGIAKVADFGVVKALGQLHEATTAGQLKGKIAYMSPEQIAGDLVDRRSDVFALGCVLYEASTGQGPFRGDSDPQTVRAILEGEYAPPSSLVPGYPPELASIVARALATDPDQRFSTAEQMRFALEEFLAHGPIVTQSNIAQVVRTRLGERLDRRKERIRLASMADDLEGPLSEPSGELPRSARSDSSVRRPIALPLPVSTASVGADGSRAAAAGENSARSLPLMGASAMTPTANRMLLPPRPRGWARPANALANARQASQASASASFDLGSESSAGRTVPSRTSLPSSAPKAPSIPPTPLTLPQAQTRPARQTIQGGPVGTSTSSVQDLPAPPANEAHGKRKGMLAIAMAFVLMAFAGLVGAVIFMMWPVTAAPTDNAAQATSQATPQALATAEPTEFVPAPVPSAVPDTMPGTIELDSVDPKVSESHAPANAVVPPVARAIGSHIRPLPRADSPSRASASASPRGVAPAPGSGGRRVVLPANVPANPY